MMTAPLVMPEIITGLSLLFLFISMANADRLADARAARPTITIAHITFSMAYVAVVVRSRLAAMDESLEEAAMDLGGRPLAVFFDVTRAVAAARRWCPAGCSHSRCRSTTS